MTTELVLTNAKIVLPDEVFLGTITVRDGLIAEIQPGVVDRGVDCGGDVVMAGIVDVHTDNLERQVQPRSNARWPSRSALLAHDTQCAAAGVTTVLDALCLGDLGLEKDRIRTFHDGVADLAALGGAGLLKSDHFLHLRCEIPALDMLELLEPVADNPLVVMVSLMDHTPGYGQYADLDRYRGLQRREGRTDAEIEKRIFDLQSQRARTRDVNRRIVLEKIRALGVVMASHDDRTAAEIAENHADGIRISEFPVTMEAARAARAANMLVIAGAPNIVRGGSHSGNVSAADLVRAGTIDAFASDYVPASLVEAVFITVAQTGITLPEAAALVSDRPARMANLTDRGRIETGLRADLIQVRVFEDLASVRAVWRSGARVA